MKGYTAFLTDTDGDNFLLEPTQFFQKTGSRVLKSEGNIGGNFSANRPNFFAKVVKYHCQI